MGKLIKYILFEWLDLVYKWHIPDVQGGPDIDIFFAKHKYLRIPIGFWFNGRYQGSAYLIPKHAPIREPFFRHIRAAIQQGQKGTLIPKKIYIWLILLVNDIFYQKPTIDRWKHTKYITGRVWES